MSKLTDVVFNIQMKVEGVGMDIDYARYKWKHKKDKFYELKKNKEYVDDDVKSIEKEFRKSNPAILARVYCIAYINDRPYDGVVWLHKYNDLDYFVRLTSDTDIRNKIKKLLVDLQNSDDGSFRNFEHEEDIFIKAKKYIGMIQDTSDYESILGDIEYAFGGLDNCGEGIVTAMEKVQTYVKGKLDESNEGNIGNESLSKTLDDLI